MKSLFISQICCVMFFLSHAQNKVYDSHGDTRTFKTEKLSLQFAANPDTIRFPGVAQKEAGPLLALIPMAVDLVFKTTTKILENNVKKFAAEYTRQSSNLLAADQLVPAFTFNRIISFDGSPAQNAFSISFEAKQLGVQPLFYYYIKNIRLDYSAARSKKEYNSFDYTIELKLTYFVKGEKKAVQIAPIVVSSVQFGSTIFSSPYENRSDLIPLTAGAILTEVAVKITETNPYKVRAQKILDTWNDHKDDARTIINNVFPEAKGGSAGSSSKDTDKKSDSKDTDKDKTTGNQ